MLQTLRVKNLAIVENIRVEFAPGLNVITGETGAGKSILAGALDLVLGARADKSMIRAGEEQCGVEAVFHLADCSEVDAVLEELGLEPCEDGRLIVRRIFSPSSGKALINDGTTTLQALKRVGTLLVDMHGPHDHQSLLSQDFQLDLLDAFGNLEALRDRYALAYERLGDIERQRKALQGDDRELGQQIELLKYQIREIEAAELGEQSEDDLEREHTMAANAQEIMRLADAANRALVEDEESAFDRIVFARMRLDELSGILDEAGEWRDEAEAVSVQIQELAKSLAHAVRDIEADPERFQWLEDRMALLHKLKRKYGATLEEIVAFAARAGERLAELEGRGEKLAELDAAHAGAVKTVTADGGKLTAARRKTAGELAKAITGHLADLGFPHGRFDVELEPRAPGPVGMDQIEFGFAPNVGEPMRPLRLIASSGEISRVMLATKTVLAEHDRIPVLVFDEIDANVGGEMGNAIGDKLAGIALNHQVICITHLPQVAVHGGVHLVVGKHVRDGRTITGIEAVDDEQRAEEIARMLGGRDLTSVTLRHAREMLRKA